MTGPPAGPPPAWPPPAGYVVPPQAYPPGYPYPPRPVYLQPPPLAPNGQPLADFFSRLGAYLVDALIMGAIGSVVTIPLMIWWVTTFVSEVTTVQTSADRATVTPEIDFGSFLLGYLAIVGVVLLVSLLVSYLYLVEFTWRTGQTIGKRVVKLKIVPVDPAAERTRGMLAKRWLVEQVGGVVIPFFSYVDGLWQLWDKPLQQCLHDKVAGTVVVKIG